MLRSAFIIGGYTPDNPLDALIVNGCLWEAAEAIDPTAKRPVGRRGSYGSAEALSQLWNGAGLTDIEITDLTMPCQFSSFDELWQRYLTGEGPSGA